MQATPFLQKRRRAERGPESSAPPPRQCVPSDKTQTERARARTARPKASAVRPHHYECGQNAPSIARVHAQARTHTRPEYLPKQKGSHSFTTECFVPRPPPSPQAHPRRNEGTGSTTAAGSPVQEPAPSKLPTRSSNRRRRGPPSNYFQIVMHYFVGDYERPVVSTRVVATTRHVTTMFGRPRSWPHRHDASSSVPVLPHQIEVVQKQLTSFGLGLGSRSRNSIIVK